MTAPPQTDLTAQHRAEVEALLSLALEEVASVWPDDPDPRAVRDSLLATVPDLAAFYGSAAGTLGADWYEEMRDEAQVAERFRAIVAPLPDLARYEALTGWAVDPLFGAEPDPVTALHRLEGGFQRVVADMDRNTVRLSLAQDPQAKGWTRQTTGKSCSFCVMIAGRGAVYSAKTADFSSHDHCDCIAVPVFGSDPRPVKAYVPSQRFREQSQRTANNARIREYLRDNPA